MYTIPQTLSFLAGILINLGLVYATYLIYTRKQCSKLLMLKAAAIVAGGTAIIAALTSFLPEYLGGLPLITDLMLIYHCARTILKVERKPAILCTITYFGIILLLGAALVAWTLAYMSHFNEGII
ncbi:MAG: hypothetical protein IIV41_08150 [Akkermansia sp.]|nr:hypothetical protein [Akkermansia sp.]